MLVSSLTSIALACGGFFCDSAPTPDVDFPVSQTAESVVFAVDATTGTTTMHVQVSYEGPADAFAWVIPVPTEPELLRSTQALFEHVQRHTAPRWRADVRDHGCATDPVYAEADTDTDTDADTDADADADTDADALPPTVTVIARQNLGPYETVTLTASNTIDLVAWLRLQGFSIPSGAEAALFPYLGDTTHFVALRLQKDRDAGDLEPFAMRFDGTSPSIPIQLTALAVDDDMPLEVYVLGPSRAIPENYLHVRRNPFKSDWTLGVDDLDVVSRAVDEAGGQAFETVFAGQTPALALPDEAMVAALAEAPGLAAWLTAIAVNPVWDLVTTGDLAQVVPLSDTIVPDAFFACPQCYPAELAAIEFDAADFTEALEAQWLAPTRDAAEMLEASPTLTRMRSTMSASEMTLDPRFGFRDLEPVSSGHVLRVDRYCADGQYAREAAQSVQIEDFAFDAPSEEELADRGLQLETWLATLGDERAMVIEDLSTGEILVDHRDRYRNELIPGAVAGSPSVRSAERSCGCRTSPLTLGAWALPLLVLARRRLGWT